MILQVLQDQQKLVDGFLDAIVARVVAQLKPVLEGSRAVRPRLLTVEQAAVYLGRTEKAVYNMKARGVLPTVQGDNRITFDIQDLDQWIQNNKEG